MKKIFIECTHSFYSFTLEEIRGVFISDDYPKSTLILKTINGSEYCIIYNIDKKLYVKALMNLIIKNFNFDGCNVSCITHEDLNDEYRELLK